MKTRGAENTQQSGLENARMITGYPFFLELTSLPFMESISLYGPWADGSNDERTVIDLAFYCPTAEPKDWQEALDILENAKLLVGINAIRMDKLGLRSIERKRIAEGHILLFRRSPAGYRSALSGAREMTEWHLKVLKDTLESDEMDPAKKRHTVIVHFKRTMRHFWHYARYVLAASGVSSYTPAACLRHAFMAGWLNDRASWEELLDLWMQMVPEGTVETEEKVMQKMDEFVALIDAALGAIANAEELKDE